MLLVPEAYSLDEGATGEELTVANKENHKKRGKSKLAPYLHRRSFQNGEKGRIHWCW
jgi:hypothetical protein